MPARLWICDGTRLSVCDAWAMLSKQTAIRLLSSLSSGIVIHGLSMSHARAASPAPSCAKRERTEIADNIGIQVVSVQLSVLFCVHPVVVFGGNRFYRMTTYLLDPFFFSFFYLRTSIAPTPHPPPSQLSFCRMPFVT